MCIFDKNCRVDEQNVLLENQINVELPQLAKNNADDDKVPETAPGSSSDQVYGTERGQHRFLFEFPRPPAGRDMDDTPSPVLMEREPLLVDD